MQREGGSSGGARVRAAALAIGVGLAGVFFAIRAPASDGGRCPTRAEVARLLTLEGTGWQTACKSDEGGHLLLAAFAPPAGKTAVPELVLALARGKTVSKRLLWKIGSGDDKRLPDVIRAAQEWRLSVTRTRLGGQNLINVALNTKWGGAELQASYEIVGFFREGGDSLVPLWTGIGDWEENRHDTCLLKARASFKLETSITSEGRGKLERTTRIARRKGSAPLEPDPAQPAAQAAKPCTFEPVQREVFPVAVAPL